MHPIYADQNGAPVAGTKLVADCAAKLEQIVARSEGHNEPSFAHMALLVVRQFLTVLSAVQRGC
jgi:hypothetical protein